MLSYLSYCIKITFLRQLCTTENQSSTRTGCEDWQSLHKAKLISLQEYDKSVSASSFFMISHLKLGVSVNKQRQIRALANMSMLRPWKEGIV